jgi:hypothetical protein
MNALERVIASVVAFLNAINTHTFCGVGLVTGGIAIPILAAAPLARAYIGAHPNKFGGVVGVHVMFAYINIATSWATAALPPALLAAAFGRPPNVPAGPVRPPDGSTPPSTPPAAVVTPLKPAA